MRHTYKTGMRKFGYGVKRLSGSAGFSLLEVVVATFLGTVVLTALFQLYISLWQGYAAINQDTQYTVIGLAMKRTWLQDLHAAVYVAASPDTLELMMSDGTEYQYYVNSYGQMIRTQTGGGTTVMAVGVGSLAITTSAQEVSCSVNFVNGHEQAFRATTLGAVLVAGQ